MDERSVTGSGGPPDRFLRQVKDALMRLYDFPGLQTHPLASSLALDSSGQPGRRLRQLLIDAIEKLNPGSDAPFGDPRGRLYNVLLLHYVEGMIVREAADELSMSERQAHRDLRRGEESVAAILWSQRAADLETEPGRRLSEMSSVERELDRLECRKQSVDVRELIRSAQQAIQQLASQHDVQVTLELPEQPLHLITDTVIARQVLVYILSRAVTDSGPGSLRLALQLADSLPVLCFSRQGEPQPPAQRRIGPAVEQMLGRLGWQLQVDQPCAPSSFLELYMGARCPTILVVDDNQGLVELIKQYLTDQACQVIAASSGTEGLRLMRSIHPDAMILDVMMPEMDGWELLQRLSAFDEAGDFPVIVCSVIDAPELAYSLGASGFLPKPVRRDEILAALHDLQLV
jgi:CheY-like chemotaxis protein